MTGADGTVRAWDANTGEQKWSRAFGKEPHVSSVVVSPDGAWIAAGGVRDQPNDAGVRILRSDTGENVQFIPTERKLRAIAFSADGGIVAVVHVRPKTSNMFDLDLYEAQTGKHRMRIGDGFFLSVHAMAFSHDAKSLYTLDRNSLALGQESHACVWDVATGKRLRQFTAFKPPIKPLPPGPNGKPEKPWIASAVFARDLKTLIASQGRELVVWDVGSGEARGVFDAQGTDKGGNIAVSNDGRLVAITDTRYADDPGSDGIRVFDLASGRLIASFEPGQGRSAAFAFSPDGTRLASGMSDGTTIVWQLPVKAPR